MNAVLYVVAGVLSLVAVDVSFTNHIAAASLMVSTSAVLAITMLRGY